MVNHGTACSHVRIRNKYASVPDKYSKRQICRETVCVCEKPQFAGDETFVTALWVIDGLNSVAKGLELMCAIIWGKRKLNKKWRSVFKEMFR